MGRYDNTARNQYNSTPRKVFDRMVDRQADLRARDKEVCRADYGHLMKQMILMQSQLTLLRELIMNLHHLTDHELEHGNEELG